MAAASRAAVPICLILATVVVVAVPPTAYLVGMRLLVSAASLIWLPGWLCARLLGLADRRTLLESSALAFALGCGILSAEGMVFYALRLPMWVALASHSIVLGLLILASVRWAREGEGTELARARFPSWPLVFVGIAYGIGGAVWAASRGPQLSWDTWFHLANITKLVRGQIVSPDCSFYQGFPTDIRYPWSGSHLIAGMVCSVARVEATELWIRLPRILPFITISSLAFLLRWLFDSKRIIWAGLLALAAAFPITFHGLGEIVRFPYPMRFMWLGIAPVYFGLVAAYIVSRRRALLWGIGLSAFAAASFHTTGIVYLALSLPVLGLLLVLYAVSFETRKAYLVAALATAVVLLPRMVVIALNHPGFSEESLMHYARSTGGELIVVNASGFVQPIMVVAVAASVALAPLAAARPALLVLITAALLFPLVSVNPPVATALSPVLTSALLRRLAWWPQLVFFAPLLVLLGPAATVGLWEWWLNRLEGTRRDPRRQRRSRRRDSRRRQARRTVWPLAVGLAPLTLALILLWPRLCLSLIAGGFRPSRLMMWAGVAVLGLCPLVLRCFRWRPDLCWTNTMGARGMALFSVLVVLCGGMMTLQAVGTDEDVEEDVRSPRLRWAEKDWRLDERSLIPDFMAPLAELPAGTATVFSPSRRVEETIPGLTGQFVVFGRKSGNPAADMAGREKAAVALRGLAKPQPPSEAALAALQEYAVDYILLPPKESRACGALDEYPEIFTPVHRISGSALYAVSCTPGSAEAVHERPDPWRPPPSDVPRDALFRIDGLEFLRVDFDRDRYSPGSAGFVTFEWRCVAPMERDYKIVCYMTSPDGPRMRAGHDPLENLLPTSQLRTGDIVRERYVFWIPPESHDSHYDVTMWLWHRESNDHPPVQDSLMPVVRGTRVVVGDFSVSGHDRPRGPNVP